MAQYRFTLRQGDKLQDFKFNQSRIEAEYGLLEENSYLFYSAGSSGRLLHIKNKGAGPLASSQLKAL